MEFRFNLNELFKNIISKIKDNLLPSDYSGDRRNIQYHTSKISEIIDEMGLASGKSQGLQHPITSGDKMKKSDHTLYLMIEPNDNNGRGSVVGLLKIGVKNLFVFDETGMVHEMKSMCILDFYVHESKQRTGYGKKLYDYMLYDQNIEPCKLAIDRPSEKFLSFLYKHYGMGKIYPQTNNFVLFEGFFSEKSETSGSMDSLDRPVVADHVDKHNLTGYDNHSINSEDYRATLHGRHTAVKPQDTMGKCLAWLSPKENRSVNMFHHTQFW